MSRRTWELVGWVVFGLCALLFLAAGIRDGDALVIVASMLFLLGVGAFLVPILRQLPKG